MTKASVGDAVTLKQRVILSRVILCTLQEAFPNRRQAIFEVCHLR